MQGAADATKPAEKPISQGPSVLLEALVTARRTLDTMYPEDNARQLGSSPVLQAVETCCGKLGHGVFTLADVHAKLTSTDAVITDVCKTSKALEKLHKMVS